MMVSSLKSEEKIMFKIIIALFVSVTSFSMSVYAQPAPGDECANALDAYIGEQPFSTDNMTSSNGAPTDKMCPDTFLNWGENNPDVWFKFSPSETATYEFTTCDVDSYDTSMVLYAESCANQIACNGDSEDDDTGCQSYYSKIASTLIGNQTYFIRIGGYSGDSGDGTLTIQQFGGEGPTVIYVNINNKNPGDGTTWSNAFNRLQDALDVAKAGDQIWIAQGTYIPTYGHGSQDPRDVTFKLISGVEIFGGFFGNEVSVDQRNAEQFPVILSGDLYDNDDQGQDNSNNENAYHVLTADYLFDTNAVLDSVTITRGNANGDGDNKFGGGLIIKNTDSAYFASAVISNSRFILNSATYGGAIFIKSEDDKSILNSCTIEMNNSSIYGGAIANNGRIELWSCLVTRNTTGNIGGAIYSVGEEVAFYNCTVVQNNAYSGGGIYALTGTNESYNSIFWGNTGSFGNNSQIILNGSASWIGTYNCIQGEIIAGQGNTNVNPRFVDEFGPDGISNTADENFRLLQQSPLIDAGNNAKVGRDFDLDGNDRIINDPYSADTGSDPGDINRIVDFGAYEHVPNSNNTLIWTGSNSPYFNDQYNWLPNSSPNYESRSLFNSTSFQTVELDSESLIDSILISEGSTEFRLEDSVFSLYNSTERSIQVDAYRNGATAIFKGPGLINTQGLNLNGGNILFHNNIELQVGHLRIGPRTKLGFDGIMYGDLTNKGGSIQPGGDSAGIFYLYGSLTNQDSDNDPSSGKLIGSLTFDIAGNVSGESHDQIQINNHINLSSVVELRWDRSYTPIMGDSFDLIYANSASGNPTLVYNRGLPSNLKCGWGYNQTSGVGSGSSDVVIETTGPILFESESTYSLSQTPSEIAVADFDNANGPDIAISVPDPAFGKGDVIIFLNQGMSDGIWQGFSEYDSISVGIEPVDIKVINVANDSTPNDLVIANYLDSTLTILINDESGSFSQIEIDVDTNPACLAVGNFVTTGANQLDDIAVGCDSFQMSIVENTTSLTGASFYHIGSVGISEPSDILPGDVNDDKDLDYFILAGSSGNIEVLEGDGTGTFAPFTQATTSALPEGSAAAEFSVTNLNFDAYEDIITVNENGSSISILQGNGTTLGNTSTASTGASPNEISVADFDNDGDNDFVISAIGSVSGERELIVIRNDTESAIVLSEGDAAASGNNPSRIQHGDFNQDGLEDLVCSIDLTHGVISGNSPAIGVYLNTTEVVIDCPADLDGDGLVAVSDILAIIAAWGSTDASIDLDGSGTVDVADLLVIIAAWGAC